MYSVRLTLWGANAVQFNMHDNPILAFKNVRVNDFGGRSLSTLSTSSMVANIDIPEAYPLRSWYDGQGKMAHFQSYAGGGGSLTAGQGGDELKTISQVKEENLGNGDKPDYFTIDANIIFIKSENLAYPACPSESCNKKVVLDSSSQLWHCEQCQKGFPSPKYRYIMSMSASDTTGNLWLQCFDDTGSVVLGTSANEIMELHDSNREEFDARINRRNFLKYRFRCRAKSEVYNDTSRVRYTVVSISEIDFVAESMRKFKIIESY
ncbi:Replication factor A protein 1 [Zancudomyces culisetae]|uniref:Replication factor A protein 1 n=1 Tax=Zancudomyces culisetae TaxID=1213189 RepID=A0A1R1PJR7_ZANCU|nr:Replication factor A protein 1 [Zancudomyces culisetae]|eukprot:OMH81163.1 Replication factor A protein 1 [Zancudomyces culisetae]